MILQGLVLFAPVQDSPMLLLELPKFCVDVKSPAEVSLPLLVTILGHVPQTIEQLLGLLQQVTELVDHLSFLLLHVKDHVVMHSLEHAPHPSEGPT